MTTMPRLVEQHEIEVVVAAVAIGHEHIAQEVRGAGGDPCDAARIATANHPGATAQQAEQRHDDRADDDQNKLNLCESERRIQCHCSAFPNAPVSAPSEGSRSAQDTGREKSRPRLSGIRFVADERLHDSRIFAGCAVETSTSDPARSEMGSRAWISAAVAVCGHQCFLHGSAKSTELPAIRAGICPT